LKMYQAFSRFSGRFKGHVYGQENGAGDGLGTRLLCNLKPLTHPRNVLTLYGTLKVIM